MDSVQSLIEKEKIQLLRVMKKMPHSTQIKWNVELGWRNSKNNIDLGKITKRLKQLEAEGLIIQIGHRYVVKL